MCGIAGIVRFGSPVQEADRRAVVRMRRALAHRGPDAQGSVEREGVVLGHTRLAVIDLSEHGRQPLSNETEDVLLVLNGEIYNFQELRLDLRAHGHVFRSKTDAEVVVHGYEEWGIDGLLRRLRGMFAFALTDLRGDHPRVFLARDRFGIKPLYYGYGTTPGAGRRLVFASEVGAIARSGLIDVRPSEDALAAFLSVGSVPSPSTALRGVLSLPPGHYLQLEAKHAGYHGRPQQYWALPTHEAVADPDPDPDGEARVAELLREAVTSHLVSDVPLGVFLSGGIDSASLVALASRERERPLTTLSVVFEEAAFDERVYARAVADKFRTDHHEIAIDDRAFERALPDFWKAMDQPSVDGINAFIVSKAARESGLTVVLSGLGGDEVFLGYPLHRSLARLEPYLPWMRRTPNAVFELARRVIRAPQKAESFNRGGAYWAFRGLFTPSEVESLAPGVGTPVWSAGGDTLDEAVRLEFEHYLHNQLLRDTDAMSMAHSIEARVPFLDHRLVEAVLRVPVHRKLDPSGVNKPLLLRSLPEELPREVWDRPKQGFTLPFARFLEDGPHREPIVETTLQADVFDRAAVKKLWDDFAAGKAHWSRPWSLAAYAAWHMRVRAETKAEAEPEAAAV